MCYQCKEKGHIAKNCPNSSGEEKQENKTSQENTFSKNKFQKKKALVTAWGSDPEEGPDAFESSQGRCLMAGRSSAKSATSEVDSNELFNSLNDLNKDQLIRIIKEFGKENGELQERLTEYKDEFSCLTTENAHWSKG